MAVQASGLNVSEYAPRQIKMAVVGYGGADKMQVQQMVKRLLKLEDAPKKDAADALAVAICHANTQHWKNCLAGALQSIEINGR